MYNFTVGKYIPGNSAIHNMNPKIKLLGNFILVVIIFLIEHFMLLGVILISVMTVFFMSRLPKIQILKMLKPVIFIGIFLFFANAFLIKVTKDNPEIFGFWKLHFTEKSLSQTALIMVRIYIMIIATSVLMSTTKPMALTRAIEDLLFPLKIFKIPVHIIAMIISIALRFIPTLLEETLRIMKAQASRGVDFKHGNVKTKTKSLITLIIPLFVSAFSKAEDLGNAMETRGYDPYAKRTRYRKYKFTWKDFIILLFLVALITIVALIKANPEVVSQLTWYR